MLVVLGVGKGTDSFGWIGGWDEWGRGGIIVFAENIVSFNCYNFFTCGRPGACQEIPWIYFFTSQGG